MKEATKKVTSPNRIIELEGLLEQKIRELEIEAALERVRTKAMAMHYSSELQNVVSVVFEQLNDLNFIFEGSAVFIATSVEDFRGFDFWMEDKVTQPLRFRIPYYNAPVINEIYFAWENRNEFAVNLYGREKNIWFEHAFKYTDFNAVPEDRKGWILNQPHLAQVVAIEENSMIGIHEHYERTFGAEEIGILKRFSKVFEQAYIRFLDLQKAEKQTRTAEIQLALERVRARTLAMQHSNELSETSFLLARQVRDLGIKSWGCAFHIYADSNDGDFEWFSNETGYLPFYRTPRKNFFKQFYESRKTSDGLFVKEFMKNECAEHYAYLMTLPVVGDALKELQISGIPLPESQIDHVVYFKYGYLLFITYEPVPESYEIFRQFAKEFEQTYTRFLDLKKAEALAREAEIQLALERVRARTMAMQKSYEIQEVTNLVCKQLHMLGFSMDASMIFIKDESINEASLWIGTDKEGYAKNMRIPYFNNPIIKRFQKAVKNNEEFVIDLYKKNEAQSFMSRLVELPDWSTISNERKNFLKSVPGYARSMAFCKHTGIAITNYEPKPFSEEENYTLKRFAKVFEQTYVRFLDIQKAEKQAREAQIEAALERIRAKTMAMQHSQELQEVILRIFDEIAQLGINMNSAVLVEYDAENIEEGMYLWIASEDYMYTKRIFHPFFKHKLIENVLVNVQSGTTFYTEQFSKEDKNSYFDYLFEHSDLKYISQERKQLILDATHWIRSGAIYKNAALYFIRYSNDPFTETENNIFKKFGKTVEQAYTRFQDLKKAEFQAKEALKQSSLDRIRAEIASMRTSEDLNRITPVIWRELQALKVPFIRCGVFIVDLENEKVQVFLTTPEGKALGVLNLLFDANEMTQNTVEHWKNKRIFRTHWNKEEFISWTHSMMKLGQVKNAETYQGSASAPDSLDLHLVPFKQGMLYVGNTSPLNKEVLELVKALAESFSIAYARYEDFKQLEAAKNKIEKTLTELRSTQAQLIHSEKMASLGELTAGIAHEIQNPLNFVNNFSDVNKELLDDLKAAISINDKKEIEILLNDLGENEMKISTHGKRAESIVKGMLLHSRGSSGIKEPTDINMLCDEYLRLSYHGFRAKDKSFNAEYKLEVDNSLPKVEVVPQDIGRVLLNLINNAFYAVNNKAKSGIEEYNPMVTVNTSVISVENSKRNVQITVKDNGPGIPEHVKSKIFQPFFTTKPAGQGTGLGLSLSYDIVKAHGGEVRVTSEGDGSEFIIQLPIYKQ